MVIVSEASVTILDGYCFINQCNCECVGDSGVHVC